MPCHPPAHSCALSEQIPELLGSETRIAGNGAHRDGVDRVMAGNHKSAIAVAEDQMPDSLTIR